MSRPIWSPDIVVDADLARDLIRAQFPRVGVTTIEALGFGFDNTAFMVDGRYVFRFPRRTIAVELIERENGVLPSIAPKLPLAIPVPVFHGTASDAYPWPFAGYEFIDGETACGFELSVEDRAAMAPALASFLRALHDIDPEPARAAGLPGDTMGRLTYERRMTLAIERFADLQAAQLVDDAERFLGYLATHPPAVCDRPRIVHGDLYARHLLLDEQRRLRAIIDWGDVHCGDPALDLAAVLSVLGAEHREAFEEVYGPIDAAAWERATFRAIYHCAVVAHYGNAMGDTAMLRAGLRGLNLVSAALPQ